MDPQLPKRPFGTELDSEVRTPEEWMRMAIALACANVRDGLGGPFGCVIIRNGALVGSGVNRVVAANDPTAHAEVAAIREACQPLGTFQLAGCELYASCEPCPMCLGAIHWARLQRFHFAASKHDAAEAGFDDELIYQELARRRDERSTPGFVLLSGEGLSVFDEWRRSAIKTPY